MLSRVAPWAWSQAESIPTPPRTACVKSPVSSGCKHTAHQAAWTMVCDRTWGFCFSVLFRCGYFGGRHLNIVQTPGQCVSRSLFPGLQEA